MSQYNFIDIGVNLTDPSFRGVYHEKYRHDDDFESVLDRAINYNVRKMIVTGTFLSDCREAIELCRKYNKLPKYADMLSCTVGIHPTRCREFLCPKTGKVDDVRAAKVLAELHELIVDGKADGTVVAVGEFGLDYDRLHFCDKETQLKYFEYYFELAERSGLPLFLHSRAAREDFLDIVRRNRHRFTKGVVHSFTGSADEARELLSIDGIFIGINGCSLKTEENLAALHAIPVDRLMLETDAPWCDIRSTHASHKFVKTDIGMKKKWERGFPIKGRNEPGFILQVLEVVSGVKNIPAQEIADQVYKNTMEVFFPSR